MFSKLEKKKKKEEQPPKITLNLYTLIKGSPITITFFLTFCFLFSNLMVILICYLSYELCIIKKASQLLSVYDMHLLFFFIFLMIFWSKHLEIMAQENYSI